MTGLLDSSQDLDAAYAYDGYGNILSKSCSSTSPSNSSTKAYDERQAFLFTATGFTPLLWADGSRGTLWERQGELTSMGLWGVIR